MSNIRPTAIRPEDVEKYVEIQCRQCDWFEDDFRMKDETDADALKRAWTLGLAHAWEHKGHIVETYVDGKLKSTQQIATMSRQSDHRSLVVDESVRH
jgi:hypothetical protein